MPAFETILLFTAAACIANVSPGPSMVFVTTTSLSKGQKVGFFSALGLSVGLIFHIFASTLGLSVIFIYSPLFFSICKYLGAVYLIYIGILTFKSSGVLNEDDSVKIPKINTSLKKSFSQGIFIETLNPKTSLFFMSFLPQFVETQYGSTSTQLFIFGSIFLIVSFSRDILLVVTSSSVSTWLQEKPSIQNLQRKIAGTMLVGIGIGVAIKE